MRVLAILLSGLLLGGTTDDTFVLSVAAFPGAVSLSDPVLLLITLKNRSDEPRYVHRNVERHLDFAVFREDGRHVRRFVHPFTMPLTVTDSRDWVRVEPRQALRCTIEVRLAQLGIERAGVFSLRGFWAADSVKRPKEGAGYAIHFEHAADTFLTVTAARAPSAPPPTKGSLVGVSSCRSAEAQSQ
jgi:hypothetical protein